MAQRRNRCGYRKKYPQAFNVYWSIRNRCENKNSKSYERYGGKGITVCDRWRGYDGLKNFVDDMYPRPTEEKYPNGRSIWSIDRKDNSKGYSPENCRWATSEQQANNRSYGEDVGVRKTRGSRTWTARYRAHGMDLCKSFNTKEEALRQRKEWEEKYHLE